MKKYSKFLNIGTNIFENTGQKRNPSYNDIIDYSADFFTSMQHFENSIFNSLKWRFRKDKKSLRQLNMDFKPEVTKKSWIKSDEYKADNPEHNITEATSSPFIETVVTKTKGIGNGNRGNVFELSMHKVWDSDPLKAQRYSDLSGQ